MDKVLAQREARREDERHPPNAERPVQPAFVPRTIFHCSSLARFFVWRDSGMPGTINSKSFTRHPGSPDPQSYITPAIPVSIGALTYSRGSVTYPVNALAATVSGLAR